MASSVARPRSSKALPKVKPAPPKKSHGHSLVVCCPSGPLQLCELWRNHYIREVCSENAMKTATPAASTGQQKGPNSSPRQNPTAHRKPMLQKLNELS